MTDMHAAIVTGASSGIGAAIARRLCENDVTVYALARDITQLQKVRRGLAKRYQKYFVPISCDVSLVKSVDTTLKQIFSKDSIDLVVNNAGIGFSNDFTDYTDEEIDRVIATNLRGTISVTRAALRNRNPERYLHIVNTTSLAGRIGFPQLSIYTASKFAIEGLTESLEIEYAKEAVGFTILRPGITDTAFFSKAGMETYRKSVKDLKSFYSPDQVAAIFLAKLGKRNRTIVVGNDKVFLALLPFTPFSKRFNLLDLVNKL